MILKVGQSLASAVDGTTLVVLRPAEGDVTLTCGGVQMSEGKTTSGDGTSIDAAHIGGALIGKRYVDEASGLEVLCTKPGQGSSRWAALCSCSRGPHRCPLRTECSGPNEEWSLRMNISMLLDMAVDGFGDRVVIGTRDTGITASRLRELAIAGAATVRDSGADAIVYLAVNGPAFPVAMFAAARAGVPLVPVNYRLGREQLDALLANHPRALGIADPNQAEVLERAGLNVRTPAQWLQQLSEPDVTKVDEDEGLDTEGAAVVIYTSGTTSAPKGVLLRHENLSSYVIGSVEFANAEDADAALVSVPPYHIAAVANVITNLYAGRRTMVLEQFTPEQWLDTVRDEGITNALVVPTMLARIVDSDADKTVPALRGLAYGERLCPPGLSSVRWNCGPRSDSSMPTV
ncbi:hypothetical protein GCM10020255_013000 [Rhodococcus baikonurensis]